MLETDNEVIMNNANEVDGNKYIWNLNEDDLEDGIKFQIKKESSTLLLLPVFLMILLHLYG